MSKATTTKRASTTKKRSASAASKKVNIEQKTGFDFLMALLVVSLLFNLLTICVWVVLRVTNMYDADLASLFLAR